MNLNFTKVYQLKAFGFISVFLLLTTSCQSLHSLKKNPSDKELFQHASRLKEKLYYKEALTYFQQLKTRFLYSHLVKEADLAIADIYFAQKEWNKAIRAYGHFSELHPLHPQSDRVIFHLALSYFYKLPRTEDRDLSLSKKTLAHFNKHLKLFPKSIYKSAVQKYKKEVLYLLARQQWMIARFHLHQNKAHSALPYMRNLVKDYSSLLPPKEPKNKNSNQQKAAVDFCKQLTGKAPLTPASKGASFTGSKKPDKDKKNCLKFIAGRRINPSSISFCNQLKISSYFKTKDKLKCLKSLNVSELPSLKSLKEHIKKLNSQG
ncbi:MAG: outer membrane protein assembly factor BamD [Bdellovibrionales bacterium]|nr:outer membrane protein assembly factor BamD [Bdellovibrionales bacterium]